MLIFKCTILIIDHISEHDWQRIDDLGYDRLQDEAVRSGPGHLALHLEHLLQRLVEHSRLQTHERFPQIRFLPGVCTI